MSKIHKPWLTLEDLYAFFGGGALDVLPHAAEHEIGGGDLLDLAKIAGATVKLTDLTDGYVPYHVSDALGLANSPIFTDGTKTGFGIAAPLARVDIAGGTNAANNSSLKLTSAVYPWIDFYSANADANNRNWRIAGVASAYGTFEILSSAAAGGVPTVGRLAITKDGFVGIKNATPLFDLDIVGADIHLDSASYARLTLDASDGSDNIIRLEEAGTTKWVFGSDDSADHDFVISNGASLSALQKFVIDRGTGRVGIGMASPVGGQLVIDITGANAGTNLAVQATGTLAICDQSTNWPGITAKNTAVNGPGFMIISGSHDTNSRADMEFSVREHDGTDFATLTTAAFWFDRYTTHLMTILRNGNVGIGTAIPGTKLDVHGGVKLYGHWTLEDIGGAGTHLLIAEGFSADIQVRNLGNTVIGPVTPLGKFDVSWGGYQGVPALMLGADLGNNTSRTNNTRKFGIIAFPHYTNAEEPIFGMAVDTYLNNNIMFLGGGDGNWNAITEFHIYTAANATTVLGTRQFSIAGDGTIYMAGNVGIGTATVPSLLTVGADAGAEGQGGTDMVIHGTWGEPASSGTASTGLFRITGAGHAVALDFGISSSAGDGYPAWIQAYDRNNLSAFYNLALQPLGGFVGIGKVPTCALDVLGTIKATQFYLNLGGLLDVTFDDLEEGETIAYDQGDSMWVDAWGVEYDNPRLTWKMRTEFFKADPDTNDPWSGAALAPGGGLSDSPGETNHPGVIRLNCGNALHSGYYFMTSLTALIISGRERSEFVFKTAPVLTDKYIRLGFQDSTTEAAPTDGIFLNIAENVLTGKTYRAGANSTTGVPYNLAAGTWYRGTLSVNDDIDLVTFNLYSAAGNLLWGPQTLVANIPTATLGHGVLAYIDDINLAGPVIYIDMMVASQAGFITR